MTTPDAPRTEAPDQTAEYGVERDMRADYPDAPRTEAPDLRAALEAAVEVLEMIEWEDGPPDYVATLRAALSSATPAPERLDVDAVAVALMESFGNGWLRSDPPDYVEEWRANARLLIARLTEPQP